MAHRLLHFKNNLPRKRYDALMTSTAKDEHGKRQSRVNAVRHGLTARDKDSVLRPGFETPG
jgi:hypothetical protein